MFYCNLLVYLECAPLQNCWDSRKAEVVQVCCNRSWLDLPRLLIIFSDHYIFNTYIKDIFLFSKHPLSLSFSIYVALNTLFCQNSDQFHYPRVLNRKNCFLNRATFILVLGMSEIFSGLCLQFLFVYNMFCIVLM